MRTAILAFIIALLAPAAALSQAGWRTWSYPDLHFRIDGPPGVSPGRREQPISSANGKSVPMQTVEFSLPSRDASLQVLIIDLTGTGLTTNIDAAAQSALSGSDDPKTGQITVASFPGGQARDIIAFKGGRRIRERMILVGDRLYQIQSIPTPGPTQALPEADRFFASFVATP